MEDSNISFTRREKLYIITYELHLLVFVYELGQ